MIQHGASEHRPGSLSTCVRPGASSHIALLCHCLIRKMGTVTVSWEDEVHVHMGCVGSAWHRGYAPCVRKSVIWAEAELLSSGLRRFVGLRLIKRGKGMGVLRGTLAFSVQPGGVCGRLLITSKVQASGPCPKEGHAFELFLRPTALTCLSPRSLRVPINTEMLGIARAAGPTPHSRGEPPFC